MESPSLSEAQKCTTDKLAAQMGNLEQARNEMRELVEARLTNEGNLVTTRSSQETQPLGRIMPAFFEVVTQMLARTPSKLTPHDVQRFNFQKLDATQ